MNSAGGPTPNELQWLTVKIDHMDNSSATRATLPIAQTTLYFPFSDLLISSIASNDVVAFIKYGQCLCVYYKLKSITRPGMKAPAIVTLPAY